MWVWDLHAGTLIKHLPGFPDVVEGVAFSLDGSVLVAGSRDGWLRAYSTSGYLPLFETASPGGVMNLTVSPDCRFLATGRADGMVDLRRVGP